MVIKVQNILFLLEKSDLKFWTLIECDDYFYRSLRPTFPLSSKKKKSPPRIDLSNSQFLSPFFEAKTFFFFREHLGLGTK